MTSTTVPGWTPVEDELEIDWFRPVPASLGNPAAGITACPLPDRRAIVVWIDSPRVEFAVVDSMRALLGDDVVTAGMVQTAVTAGLSVDRCSVFTVDGEVYLTVMGSTSLTAAYWTRLYKLDDPLAPSTWTLRSTIHPGADWSPGTGTDFGGALQAGIPLVLDSGRWVLNGVHPYNDSFFTSTYKGRVSALWYSDNQGASWTLASDFNTEGDIGRSSDDSSPQIARHPANGRLYAAIGFPIEGTTDHHEVAKSTTDGASWTSKEGAGRVMPILDNRVDVYGVRDSAWGEIYRLDVATETWVATGDRLWFTASAPNDYSDMSLDGVAAKFVSALGAFYAFVGARVAIMAQHGWQHGSVGFG